MSGERIGGTFKYVRGGRRKYGVKLWTENGWKYLYGFRTKKSAEAEFRRRRGIIEKGGDPFPVDTKFKSYAKAWLEHKRTTDRLRAHTLHRYEGLLRDDIYPVVGGMELRRIKPAHVREVLNRMNKRGLSPSTITQGRAVFSGVLKLALADSLIETNPVTAISRPKLQRPQKAVPKPEQMKALIELARGTEMEIPVLLGATTAARRSEVCALRWPDIDFTSARMSIREGLQWLPVGKDKSGRTRRQLVFTGLKSDEATREVGLGPVVIERLRQHRVSQNKRRLAAGDGWVDAWPTLVGGMVELNLVCDRGDGRPIDPDAFTKSFKRLAAKAGLDPRTTLHDLRHAVLTQLGRDGVHRLIVSAVAGHSDPAFTMRVYQHAWDEGVDEAAAALAKALDL